MKALTNTLFVALGALSISVATALPSHAGYTASGSYAASYGNSYATTQSGSESSTQNDSDASTQNSNKSTTYSGSGATSQAGTPDGQARNTHTAPLNIPTAAEPRPSGPSTWKTTTWNRPTGTFRTSHPSVRQYRYPAVQSASLKRLIKDVTY
jgi:hypothetical protein